MRTRRIIVGVVFGAGILVAGTGGFITRYSDRWLAGSQLFAVALAFMAGAVIYLMATDDPQVSTSMLGETGTAVTGQAHLHVDLREQAAENGRVTVGA